jgi:hypothetical protein
MDEAHAGASQRMIKREGAKKKMRRLMLHQIAVHRLAAWAVHRQAV